jgi:DNA polymerase III sliding clamp (beta) subunit (PCNA family)
MLDDLTAPLSSLARLISVASIPPELSMLRIAASGLSVTLTASDGQTRLAVDIPGDVDEAGDVLVDGRRFINFVSGVPDANECRLRTVSPTWLSTRVGKHSARLHYMGADLYPPPPRIDRPLGTVDPFDFARALRRSMFAAEHSKNDQFSVVQIVLRSDEVRVAATDRVRAAMDVTSLEGNTESASFVLPLKSVEFAERILSSAETVIGVGTSSTAKHFCLTATNWRFSTLAANPSTFPDVWGLAPASAASRITVATEVLLGELRALIVLTDETTHAVDVSVVKAGLLLSVRTPAIAQDRVIVPGAVVGSRVSTRINARYLADAAQATECPEFSLHLSDNERALIVVTSGEPEDTYRCVISPLDRRPLYSGTN